MSDTLSIRPRRLAGLLALAIAAVSLFAAAPSAQAAGPGTFDFTGKGRCDQTLQMTLIITSPSLTVYGLTSAQDWTHVWYRLVDLNGNAQTDWIYKQAALASSTVPARIGATQITRGASKTYSRIQFYVQYFSRGVNTWYAWNTLQAYDLYGFGGALFGKTYNGVGTACFG